MKFSYKIIALNLFVMLLAFCSPKTKLPAWSPIGNYDYVVEDTPMGNMTGTMMIAEGDEGYSIKLASPSGSINLYEINFMEKSMTGKFEFDGTPMEVEGAFEGDSFKGVILSGFGNFPLTATKKQNN